MKFEAATDARLNSRASPRSIIAGRAVKASAMPAQIIGGPCRNEVGERSRCGFVMAASRLERRRGTRRRRQFKFESKAQTYRLVVVYQSWLKIF